MTKSCLRNLWVLSIEQSDDKENMMIVIIESEGGRCKMLPALVTTGVSSSDHGTDRSHPPLTSVLALLTYFQILTNTASH